MNPRNLLANKQDSAHPWGGAKFAFALVAVSGSDTPDGTTKAIAPNTTISCTPSPIFRSGRLSVRPLFGGRRRPFPADKNRFSSALARLAFPIAIFSLESPAIKTLTRGLAVCVSNPSFWQPLLPYPLPVAHRAVTRLQPLNAPLAVPSPVPLLRTPRAEAKPKARLSVRLRAAYPAAFRACQPAVDLNTALRGNISQFRTIRAVARVVLLHFTPCVSLKGSGHV